MKFEIEYIDKSKIEAIPTTIDSFKHQNEIELNYKYVREVYYERIELEIELIVKNENIIPKLGISKTAILPNQYPGSFELINEEKKIVSIPHEGGIYLLELETLNYKFIEYLRSKRFDTNYQYYKESFFYLDNFILVGRDNFLIFNTLTFEKRIVEMYFENQEEIQSIKIINSEIIISVNNYTNGKYKYFLISKFDFVTKNSFKKYLLSEYIDDNNFIKDFQDFTIGRFNQINNYKDKSIIDSWNPIFTPRNKLIGKVFKYDDCITDNNGKITRKDSSTYIEIKIKNEC